jgi:hypothetical protein
LIVGCQPSRAGERERVNHLVEQFLADAFGEGRLLEGQVVVLAVDRVVHGVGASLEFHRRPTNPTWPQSTPSLPREIHSPP